MRKLKHNDYILDKDGKTSLVRPCGYKTDLTYDVLEYQRVAATEKNINLVADQIQKNLSKDFLSHDFKRRYGIDGHQHRGLCVVATMVLLYLVDSEDLVPMSATDNEGLRHWWVQSLSTSNHYDITKNQYGRKELRRLYNNGKITAYYGWGQRPAARFLDLIEKIQPTTVRVLTSTNPYSHNTSQSCGSTQ